MHRVFISLHTCPHLTFITHTSNLPFWWLLVLILISPITVSWSISSHLLQSFENSLLRIAYSLPLPIFLLDFLSLSCWFGIIWIVSISATQNGDPLPTQEMLVKWKHSSSIKKFLLYTIYYRQGMETAWMSTDRLMDKESVVQTYNRIVLSQKMK